MKKKRIKGRKNTKPCTHCACSLNKSIVIQTTTTVFDEEGIFSHTDNVCPKCNYKEQAHEKRAALRIANCPDAKFENVRWGGYPDTGYIQVQCSGCNLYCTQGEVNTF